MIKVIYNKACGRCVQSEPLTSGMVGQTIHFEYSHDFDGLAATAVFTDGKNTVNVVNPGNECIIPHEVLTTVGAMVKVGIYAVRGDELVIPTVYATIGFVLKGADPNGGISEDPTLPVWAQTQAMIGNLNALKTQAKDNLVLAVNEVKNTTDGKQDTISDLEAIRSGAAKGATALQSVPNSYRTAAAQDVIDSGLSDRVSAIEGKEAGWNGKYSKPTDGIPKTDLESAVQTSLGKAETALQSVPSTYRTASEQDTIDSGKVDKVTGKGLSSNDYTDAAKAKVDALAPVATSGSYNDLTNKPTIPTAYDDTELRQRIGDIEAKESTWDAKSNFSGSYNDLTDKPTIPTALPNPHKLTINGTEYDGSTDVQMTIEGGGGSGSVQSDWNQNDSTAADYVKNRPFYTGNPVETVLVEESTVSFYNVSGDLYMGTLSQEIPVIVGETYKVYWDSTAYECVCAAADGTPALGNLSIMEFGPDTGEPFLVGIVLGERTEIYTTDTSASHTISIRGLVPEIVKIDKKYLPFDIPTKTSELENDAGYLTLATLPKYEGVVV